MAVAERAPKTKTKPAANAAPANEEIDSVVYDAKAGTLTVVMNVIPGFPDSKSGASRLVASTKGNAATGVKIDGQELMIGFNAYLPYPKG